MPVRHLGCVTWLGWRRSAVARQFRYSIDLSQLLAVLPGQADSVGSLPTGLSGRAVAARTGESWQAKPQVPPQRWLGLIGEHGPERKPVIHR